MACCMMLLISHDHHQPVLPAKQAGNLNMHEYARFHKTWVFKLQYLQALLSFCWRDRNFLSRLPRVHRRQEQLQEGLCLDQNCVAKPTVQKKRMAVVFSL